MKKNVDFDQERAWWDSKAPHESEELADEKVNKLLRWRIIERHLAGVRTILEVGGGTGAFSIPLARRGYKVTHLDFSPAMVGAAKANAKGIPNIDFVVANSADLHALEDGSFDLVLNMDGAVSFCGSAAEQAIAELA
jgi:2-polyprenyl-3-methyl-5-hydroxy-6-metoxy-1,4-benzoquinol methylase